MQAVCVSCFNYYDNRIKYIESFLTKKGYEVIYITSNFDHIRKVKYAINRSNVIQIPTLPYYKNLSFQRLLSHYLFSKRVIDRINEIRPDLLYIIIPPNSLVKFVSRYVKKSHTTLIYDLYDLWPETFPSTKAKKLLAIPFKFWGKLRDKNIGAADVVFTECKLYQDRLKEQLSGIKTCTLYLTKEDTTIENSIDVTIDTDSVNICYLGSINNIIDISRIHKLLHAINKLKPVTLHIIGDGESREQFINTIRSSNINVNFEGKIFDEAKKKAIFDKCSFGLNIMKDTVCVGLTMKSIDYFQAGLPILNNIKADTEKIVENYEIGFNVNDENIDEIAKKVANFDKQKLSEMKIRTKRVFDELFSIAAFNNKLETVLKEVIE